jgi:hypothetical protein
MRRVAHVLVNIATALSLLLFVASCALWVRSASANDEYYRSVLVVWDGYGVKESAQSDTYVGWAGGTLYVGRGYERSSFWDGPDVGTHVTAHWTRDAPASRERVAELGWNQARMADPGAPAPVLPAQLWAMPGASYVAIPGITGELRVRFWILALVWSWSVPWVWRRSRAVLTRGRGGRALCPT